MATRIARSLRSFTDSPASVLMKVSLCGGTQGTEKLCFYSFRVQQTAVLHSHASVSMKVSLCGGTQGTERLCFYSFCVQQTAVLHSPASVLMKVSLCGGAQGTGRLQKKIIAHRPKRWLLCFGLQQDRVTFVSLMNSCFVFCAVAAMRPQPPFFHVEVANAHCSCRKVQRRAEGKKQLPASYSMRWHQPGQASATTHTTTTDANTNRRCLPFEQWLLSASYLSQLRQPTQAR